MISHHVSQHICDICHSSFTNEKKNIDGDKKKFKKKNFHLNHSVVIILSL